MQHNTNNQSNPAYVASYDTLPWNEEDLFYSLKRTHIGLTQINEASNH